MKTLAPPVAQRTAPRPVARHTPAQADQRPATEARRQALAAIEHSPRQLAQRQQALPIPSSLTPLPTGPVVQPVWKEAALGAMAGGALGWLAGLAAGPGALLGALGGAAYGYLNPRQPAPQLEEGKGPKLPANELWKLYINPKDFAEAQKLDDPGKMYDLYGPKTESNPTPKEGSGRKGYQQSMEEAVKNELLTITPGKASKKMNFEEYQRLHGIGVKYLTPKKKEGGEELTEGFEVKVGQMKELSGRSSAFPINDWDDKPTHAAPDLLSERIPLPERGADASIGLVRTQHDFDTKKGDDRFNYIMHYRDHADDQGDDQFMTVYENKHEKEPGKEYANAIFSRYYNEVDEAKQHKDQKAGTQQRLEAVVRATRALHVAHIFKDGNGRLNGQLLLNRLLLEQGFDPAILPEDKGLGVLGGAFSVPELAEMVKQGAVSLEDVRKAHKPKNFFGF